MTEQRHLGFLMFICFVATMGGFLFGYDTIVISGTQEQVARQFQLSSSLQGQFTNMAIIGCLVGVAITIVLGDRVSRKVLLIFSSVVLLLGAIGCGLARSATELFAMRWLGGLGVGVASVLAPLYITEVAPPNLRGRLVTLFQLMINLGLLAAAAINAWLAAYSQQGSFSGRWLQFLLVDEVWRGMFLMQALPGVVFVLLCLALPESPRWLVKEGRYDQAGAVLQRIRSTASARAEVGQIREAVVREKGSFRQLFEPRFRKALAIGLFLTLIGDLSGVTAVFYYGPGILERAGFAADGSMMGFVVISTFIVIGTLLASWLIDRVGRRPLLLVSTGGCVASLLGAGLLLLGTQSAGHLLVVLICAFVLFFGIGLGPIKFTIVNEIFPTRLRGRASALCTLGLWTSVSLVASLFPVVRDHFGMAVCFFTFAVILGMAFPVMLFGVPETKGRSLEALEETWPGRASSESTDLALSPQARRPLY